MKIKKVTWNLIDIVLAIGVLVGVSVACFLPAIFWTAIYFLLSPQGFWQKAVIFGFGVWVLGGFQFLGLILFIVFWASIISEWYK